MDRVLLICLLNLLVTGTHAQAPCEPISGKIIDEHDGSPLAYAQVRIKGTAKGTISNELGLFRLEGACTYPLALEVRHLGCIPKDTILNGTPDRELVIYLEHHWEELGLVQVRASRISTGTEEEWIPETDRVQGQEGLIGRMSRLPGVQAASTSAGQEKPVIQGLSGERVLVVQDGIPMNDYAWGTDHALEMIQGMQDKYRIIKGAEGIRFGGNGIAGSVLAESPSWNREPGSSARITTFVNNNDGGMGLGLWMERMSPKHHGFRYQAQTNSQVRGNSQTPDYWITNSGRRTFQSSLRTALDLGRHSFEANAGITESRAGIPFALEFEDATGFDNALLSGRPDEAGNFTYALDHPFQHTSTRKFYLRHNWLSPKGRVLESTAWIQHLDRQEWGHHEEDSVAGSEEEGPETHLGLLSTGVQSRLMGTLEGVQLDYQCGVDAQVQWSNTLAGDLIPDYLKTQAGLFAFYRWRNAWELGLRVEQHSWDVGSDTLLYTRGTSAGPSASLGWNKSGLWGKHELRLFVQSGYAWRPASVAERYSNGLHHASFRVERGEPELVWSPESGIKSRTGFSVKPFTFWEVRAEVFHHYFEQFYFLRPTGVLVQDAEGTFPEYQWTSTPAHWRGGQISGTVEVGQGLEFKGFVDQVIGRELAGNELPGLPPTRLTGGVHWKNEGSSGGRILVPKAVPAQIWMESKHVMRARESLAYPDLVPPPPAYTVLDAGLSWALTRDARPVLLSVQVQNLTNVRYKEYLNAYRYFLHAPGFNLGLGLNIPL